MYVMPDNLWAPQRNGLTQTIDLLKEGLDVCYYSPTGGGKTRVAIELLKWAFERGWRGKFYVNRRLLIDQTASRFAQAKLPFGIRAAEFDDQYDWSAPVQICSADTERSRVYKRKIWNPFDAELMIVDEAHLQRTQVMSQILRDHRQRGGRVVLLTATPIELKQWSDRLVISGTMQEYRECKAIVPAIVKSISQPDLSKVKRSKTGEYILNERKRAIYTQTIVGDVLDRWKMYNPDARLTFLYAPGVKESVWFTQQFRNQGVNWCHVDATEAVVDGKRTTLTRPIWAEIQERLVSGDIKGVSSRFKLREGIDIPSVYHIILATPIGSLASYIQTVGRGMRYSAQTPDNILITDHGGCYWHFGSPNHQLPWEQWWDLPARAISEMRVDGYRDQTVREPIRCPMCEGERLGGPTCPFCGFTHPKSMRHVIQEDGTIEEQEGELIRHRQTRRYHDTEKIWKGLVFGCRKYRKKRTFKQLRAWFFHEHHYYPDETIPFMPKRHADWPRIVSTVPLAELTGGPA